MSNNINLGSISYEQIKNSLTEFLKTQDTLKDYNFEGSVLQSIVSLLSYNTMYYAFYSNMLANEMFLDSAQREESIISLLKPLGVTVPTRTSARAKVKMGGSPNIPQFAQFSGKNDSGIIYNFYTLQDYAADVNADDFIDNILIVEGRQLVKHKIITNLIDYTNQTYFIADNTVDISTLIVEIDEGDGVWRQWTLLDNIGDSTENLSQTSYFVERFETGFEIQFGKENSLGNEVLDSYNTRISYLTSNGTAANNIVNFEYVEETSNNIELIQTSSGGLNGPDIDYLKFIGPKFFAAQNRAITKNDFLAISTVYLRNKGFDVSKDNFSIFGGDELFPPKYGRVFIATDSIPTSDVLDLISYLKTKCAVTILPEYVQSTSDNLTYDVQLKFNPEITSSSTKQRIISNIKNYLISNYSIISKYNITFDIAQIKTNILNNFSNVRSVDVIMNYNKIYTDASTTGVTINLENEFNILVGSTKSVTEPFLDKNGRTVQLRATITNTNELDTFVQLKTFVRSATGSYNYNSSLNYGRINVKKGILEIYNIASGNIQVDLNFINDKFITSQNTKFTILSNKVIEAGT
jgi:hypothetical protein